MTIETENRKAGPYISDGVQTIYPFNFRIFAKSDIVVTVGNDDNTVRNDDNTVLSLSSDYDVQFTDDVAGGNVVLNFAIPSGKIIVLTSDVPELQLLHLTNKGGMFPEVLETAYDRAVVLIQQLREKISRALIVPVTSSTSSPEDFLKNTFDAINDKVSQAAESAIASADSASESATSATAALVNAYLAESSAEEAYGWANTPEDVVVASVAHPNEYSAYHFAQKAKQDAASLIENDRGTFYNAFDSSASTIFEIDQISLSAPGANYIVGNLAAIVVNDNTPELPADIIITGVDESGYVTAFDIGSRGTWSTQPTDGVYSTVSDGGNGNLTVNITFRPAVPSTLSDILSPKPNQTATVLHNERAGNTAWLFHYIDRNADGIFNWVEWHPVGGDGVNLVADGNYLTIINGIISPTDNTKRQLNSIGKVIGEIFTYAGNDTPPGAIELSVGQATAIPVTAVYNALVTKCWCGEANNNDADFFYRCSNQDGTGRSVTGAFFILPDMARRFMRGRYVGQDLQNFKYEADAFSSHNHTSPSGTSYMLAIPGGYGLYPGSGGISITYSSVTQLSGGTETRPMNAPFGIFIQAYLPAVYEEDRVTVDDLVAQVASLAERVTALEGA